MSTPNKSARVLRTKNLWAIGGYRLPCDRMGGLLRTQGEGTLRTLWGFPYGAWRRRPWANIAINAAVSASFVMTSVGLGAALVGDTFGEFIAGGVGERITFVSPTGFVWSDGVRAGDLILTLGESGNPGGWVMTVQQPSGDVITSSQDRFDRSLRASTPIALLGLMSSILAFVFRGSRPGIAWATASIGVLLASTPLAVQGDPQVSSLGLGLATVLPATALIGPRIRSVTGMGAAAALLAFLAVWATSRSLAIGDPTWLEQQRSSIAFYVTWGVILSAAIELRRTGAVGVRARATGYDLAAATALVGATIVIALFLHVDAVILAIIALVLVLAYPRSRRAILRSADAHVLGGIRREAAIQASEGERARLAADLHDVPIQELSAVITRLELVEEAAEERDALRRIASQLRAVTTELRPPVLDDLGLPLAIEALADQFPGGPTISIDVVDHTRPDRHRDPEVDLAIYRVTEEALRNAVAHSSAGRVHLTGSIAADAIEIEVRDDGQGLDRQALDHARRAGRAGILAMRQRAESVGARVSLRSELGTGASVTVAWHR